MHSSHCPSLLTRKAQSTRGGVLLLGRNLTICEGKALVSRPECWAAQALMVLWLQSPA